MAFHQIFIRMHTNAFEIRFLFHNFLKGLETTIIIEYFFARVYLAIELVQQFLGISTTHSLSKYIIALFDHQKITIFILSISTIHTSNCCHLNILSYVCFKMLLKIVDIDMTFICSCFCKVEISLNHYLILLVIMS